MGQRLGFQSQIDIFQMLQYQWFQRITGRIRIMFFLLLSVLSVLNLVNVVMAMPIQHGISLTPASEKSLDIEHYFVSEKLDGIRGYWDGKALLSRQGYVINTPSWFTENLGSEPIEGELWLGIGTFQRLSSLIAKGEVDDPLWREVTFQIFDMPALKTPFKERVETMKQYIAEINTKAPHIEMIAQVRIKNLESLHQTLEEVVNSGGEGLMLHHESAIYSPYQRTDALLKLKAIEYGCAVITGFTPGKGKYQGMVGSLKVESMIEGQLKRFNIGSGLKDRDRQKPPLKGTWVRYQHNGFTDRGIPRFPRLLEIVENDCRERN